MLASEEGSVDVVQYLLRKRDVDIQDLNEVIFSSQYNTIIYIYIVWRNMFTLCSKRRKSRHM